MGAGPPTEGASPRVSTSAQAAERLPGYLKSNERPDSLALLPPPPKEGSGRYAADVETYRAMRPLRDTPRWHLAAADADVSFPHAADTFSCALGVPITETDTPNLYVLMQRAMVDAGQSTNAAKEKYRRQRPFLVYGQSTCAPEDEQVLRRNGSYPSGHAAAGWAWALILAEVAPDRATDILRRGHEFGASRVVCGVHWQSDIDTGRTIGAAVVARLHANEEFMAQLGRAKQEVAAVRAANRGTRPDCAAESRALEVSVGK
jgi:acid phosphatase (class A)